VTTTDGITVRPATREDLPGIHAIYNEAVLHTTATYDYEPRPFAYRERWFEEHEQANLAVLVAVDAAGTVIGWSALNRYHDRIGYRFTSENSVYVAAEHRGRGIGQRLLAPLIQAARDRGLHAIIAAIDATNEASVRLHARFGFTQVGLFKQVGCKFDRWLDVLYMELIL
jgi:phosphinothricin acetyltransferase